jgi:protein tyrosine phosphatase (PTP) superfamily phosphohydrolase (DUF442 family)
MSIDAIADIFNFLKLSDHITTAGQPTADQFLAIQQAGYHTVVNLAVPESKNAIPHEKSIVESLGMQYVHIPVIWEQPTFEDLDRFFSVMNENANRNVFVHCAMNMRVSAFMYLYHRLHDHKSDAQATQDLHQIWQPNETWQGFIEQAIARSDLLGDRS